LAGAGEPTTPPVGPMEPTPIAPEPMPMEAPPPKSFTSGAIIAIVGGLLILIGIFLPWVDLADYSGPTWSGLQTGIWGILPLIFAILIIVLAAVKKPLGAGILGIISLIFVILPMLIIASIAATYGVAGFAIGLFTYGWYLALIGSILAMIGGFVGHKQM
jgi:hypothetical protein